VASGAPRGGEIGGIAHVLRRKPGLHDEIVILRQEQDDAHLQHRGDLMRCRPHEFVECRETAELAAEALELFGDARALPRGDRSSPEARRVTARDAATT
jgi:hypothetical protein